MAEARWAFKRPLLHSQRVTRTHCQHGTEIHSEMRAKADDANTDGQHRAWCRAASFCMCVCMLFAGLCACVFWLSFSSVFVRLSFSFLCECIHLRNFHIEVLVNHFLVSSQCCCGWFVKDAVQSLVAEFYMNHPNARGYSVDSFWHFMLPNAFHTDKWKRLHRSFGCQKYDTPKLRRKMNISLRHRIAPKYLFRKKLKCPSRGARFSGWYISGTPFYSKTKHKTVSIKRYHCRF